MKIAKPGRFISHVIAERPITRHEIDDFSLREARKCRACDALVTIEQGDVITQFSELVNGVGVHQAYYVSCVACNGRIHLCDRGIAAASNFRPQLLLQRPQQVAA